MTGRVVGYLWRRFILWRVWWIIWSDAVCWNSFFWILILINEGDGGLWIGEILCWEGLLIVFKVSRVEGEWIGRHGIGGILVSLVHGQGLFFSITRGTKVYFIAWKCYHLIWFV